MPLSWNNGGCHHCQPDFREPGLSCFLVNKYGEPLVYLDAPLYTSLMHDNTDTKFLWPHEFPSLYPDDGPLAAHLTHQAGLEKMGEYGSTIARIRPLLRYGDRMRLDGIMQFTRVDTMRVMRNAIRDTRAVWGPARPEPYYPFGPKQH